MFPQGAGGKCQSPVVTSATVTPLPLTPPQRRRPQESLSQGLTKCCSQFSPFLLGRILCLGGSRDTFPGPHICFHAGPKGKESKCLRGHNEWCRPCWEDGLGHRPVQGTHAHPGWGSANTGPHPHTDPPSSARALRPPSALTPCWDSGKDSVVTCGRSPWMCISLDPVTPRRGCLQTKQVYGQRLT